MPSPLGHILGGLAAGWLVAGRSTAGEARDHGADPSSAPSRPSRDASAFGALGAAPDLDLLVGLHSMYTHSVGAAALVAAAAYAMRGERRARWAVACGAAIASHILLDWLGSDTTPPIGIMALWPFSSGFYQSSLWLFPAVSRRFGEWSFVTQNLRAVVWELVLLLPITIAIGWVRRRPITRLRELPRSP